MDQRVWSLRLKPSTLEAPLNDGQPSVSRIFVANAKAGSPDLSHDRNDAFHKPFDQVVSTLVLRFDIVYAEYSRQDVLQTRRAL